MGHRDQAYQSYQDFKFLRPTSRSYLRARHQRHFVDRETLLVSMEDLMRLYVTKLGELIGQGILSSHLAGCLERTNLVENPRAPLKSLP